MKKNQNLWGVYRSALREAHDVWGGLLAFGVVAVLAVPLGLLVPLPIKIAVDNILDGVPVPAWLDSALPDNLQDPTLLPVIIAFAFVSLSALVNLRNGLEWQLRERLGDRLVAKFRIRLFDHALQSSVLFHELNGSQNCGYRIAYDAPSVTQLCLFGLVPTIISCVFLAGILLMTVLISPTIGAVALVTSIPLIVLVHMNEGHLRTKWHNVKELEAANLSCMQQVLNALRTVVLCGQERRERLRFRDAAWGVIGAKTRVLRTLGIFDCLIGFTGSIGTGVAFYLALRMVEAGSMTKGELLLILAYLPQLYGPIQHIGSQISGQQAAAASLERATAVLLHPPRTTETMGKQPSAAVRGDIEFQEVFLSYDGVRPVLTDLNLKIPAGSSMGIVGESGSGKTSLASLLLGLFAPTSGCIRIDGREVAEYREADLRRQFAVVGQDPVLFPGTIAENIRYACPEATQDRVLNAAMLAEAHEFISRLPNGYDTSVGDAGMTLSGGERQRIAIARAILRDAPILVLDEPTSALDAETESRLIRNLRELMRGRTTVLITHQVSMLDHVDRVLTLGADCPGPVAPPTA